MFYSVVTLLIVNSDGFTPAEFDTVFRAASLDTLSYSPSASSLEASAWPTLGTMIDAGTRLVTFLDTGADFTSVAYLINGMRLYYIFCVHASTLFQNSQMFGKLHMM